MPLLGFGVFQIYDTERCVLEAFKAGYRQAAYPCFTIYVDLVALRFGRHVDSAQAYRNEDQVGLAIKKSGLERGELFISAYLRMQYSIQGADTLPYIFLLYLQINTS